MRLLLIAAPHLEFHLQLESPLIQHPAEVDLGFGLKRSQRGRPVLADAKVGKRVLERVQRISKRYGTKMTIKDNVGLIKG